MAVEAVFHDRDTLNDGVEALFEKSVPADSIRVFLRTGAGERGRELDVGDEPGTLHGALTGAGVGAVVGLVVAIAVGSGLLGPSDVSPFGLTGIVGAFKAMLAGAVAGVPLGALLGMGHWRGHKRVDAGDMSDGGALVVVDSDELASLSERALRDAGGQVVRPV
jgi:hypothetical protein